MILKKPNWHTEHLLRAMLLLGFSIMLVNFLASGSIQTYISPQMVPFSCIAVGVLLILCVFQLLRSAPSSSNNRTSCECGCHHTENRTFRNSWVLASVFLIPLLTGTCFPPQILDNTLVPKRGIDTQLAQTDLGLQPFAQQLHNQNKLIVHDALYVKTLQAIEMFPELFNGTPIQISGFVYRDTTMSKSSFVLSRFHITCCTADATIVGIWVDANTPVQINDSGWVQVEGKLVTQSNNGSTTATIQLTDAKSIAQPATPYVY